MSKFDLHHQILGSRTTDLKNPNNHKNPNQEPNKQYAPATGVTLLLCEAMRLLPGRKHSKGRKTTDYHQQNEASLHCTQKVFGIITDVFYLFRQCWHACFPQPRMKREESMRTCSKKVLRRIYSKICNCMGHLKSNIHREEILDFTGQISSFILPLRSK